MGVGGMKSHFMPAVLWVTKQFFGMKAGSGLKNHPGLSISMGLP
jgi:hypothetical protein